MNTQVLDKLLRIAPEVVVHKGEILEGSYLQGLIDSGLWFEIYNCEIHFRANYTLHLPAHSYYVLMGNSFIWHYE